MIMNEDSTLLPSGYELTWIRAICNHGPNDHDGKAGRCGFTGHTWGYLIGDRLTWDCPNCDCEYSESMIGRKP